VPTPTLLQRLARVFDFKSYSVSEPLFPMSIFGAQSSATAADRHALDCNGPAGGCCCRAPCRRGRGHDHRKDVLARAPAPDHPAYGLVHDCANEWTSAAELREQVTRRRALERRRLRRALQVQGW
jgi:hypothetical protein